MEKIKKVQTKKKTKERGITLIALIITIIVLLILAGVALASLFGENGILNNAESAKLQSNHTSVAEGLKLKMGEYQIAKNVEGYSEDFITYLKEYENGAILDENGVINVKNLLGKKLSTGNGTGTTDVYKLEESVETAKLASLKEIKIAEASNKQKYILRYYQNEGNFVKLEIFDNINKTTSSEETNSVDCICGDTIEEGLCSGCGLEPKDCECGCAYCGVNDISNGLCNGCSLEPVLCECCPECGKYPCTCEYCEVCGRIWYDCECDLTEDEEELGTCVTCGIYDVDDGNCLGCNLPDCDCTCLE